MGTARIEAATRHLQAIAKQEEAKAIAELSSSLSSRGNQSDNDKGSGDRIAADDVLYVLNKRQYERETERINSELQKRRSTSAAFLPALYLRGRNPSAAETLRLLGRSCKAVELGLRYNEIEKLDEMLAKLWALLSADGRTAVTMAEYTQFLLDFQQWETETYGPCLSPPPAAVWQPPNTTVHHDSQATASGPPTGAAKEGKVAPLSLHLGSPPRSPSFPEAPSMAPATSSSAGTTARDSTDTSAMAALIEHIHKFEAQRRSHRQQQYYSSSCSQSSPMLSSSSITGMSLGFPGGRSLATLLQDSVQDPTLEDVLFLCTIPPPRPDMQLFLSLPRSAANTVSVVSIYQVFWKKVSLVKSEVELMIWDRNNDGRLSEDEVENYVRDLAPRIVALQSLTPAMLPFYCCTVSRRLFWDIDPGNRGALRIYSLLQSAVMDEWVSLQLMAVDDSMNWFGAIKTQEIYNKFLLLDTRNKGTLNIADLRRYKKGLPTVVDDGLPPDISPLSALFIDRYFETNVMVTRAEMDYRKFVDFVIAVELLPQCSRPHFFWNILDMDGSGALTPMCVNYFFRETHAKLVSAGLPAPKREMVVLEVFDLIEKEEPLRITREEFTRSPNAGLFVALLIDCLLFWTHENRETR